MKSSGTNWRRPDHAQRTDPSACPICKHLVVVETGWVGSWTRAPERHDEYMGIALLGAQAACMHQQLCGSQMHPLSPQPHHGEARVALGQQELAVVQRHALRRGRRAASVWVNPCLAYERPSPQNPMAQAAPRQSPLN